MNKAMREHLGVQPWNELHRPRFPVRCDDHVGSPSAGPKQLYNFISRIAAAAKWIWFFPTLLANPTNL